MLSLHEHLVSEEFWVCWSCLWSVLAKLWWLICSWCRTGAQQGAGIVAVLLWSHAWPGLCHQLCPHAASIDCCSCLLNLEIPHDERAEQYRRTACPTPSPPASGNSSSVHLPLAEVTCCGKETPPRSSNSTANTPRGNSFLSQQWGLACGLHGSGQGGTGVTDAAPCAREEHTALLCTEGSVSQEEEKDENRSYSISCSCLSPSRAVLWNAEVVVAIIYSWQWRAGCFTEEIHRVPPSKELPVKCWGPVVLLFSGVMHLCLADVIWQLDATFWWLSFFSAFFIKGARLSLQKKKTCFLTSHTEQIEQFFPLPPFAKLL